MVTKAKLQFNLAAKKRETLGRKVAALRSQGLLPAVVYGQKTQNLNIVLDALDFDRVFSQTGENTLIDLQIEGLKKGLPVLVHDFQKDPLTGKVLHVDFYSPDLEKEVSAWVPLKFIGESRAVKDLGGTLIKNVVEVEVKALPLSLPHELIVDISQLEEFGDEVLAGDLQLPAGVRILKDPEDVLATVIAPTRVEEELEKPIEEKPEEVEKVVEEKEEPDKEGPPTEGESKEAETADKADKPGQKPSQEQK